MANRLAAWGGVWVVVLVTGCGGGGGGSAPVGPAPIEVQLARDLAGSGLEKNPAYFPVTTLSVDEPFLLAQADQQLFDAVAAQIVTGRYQSTLNRLAERAQIARVQVAVVSDLACTAVPFGGGVAADRLLALDGKLLDLMAELANAIALRETGRISATDGQIVDAAAAQQLSFVRFCLPADPVAFPDAVLTPAEFDRSVEIFTQLVGGLFFHEFGHVWGWHTLAGLRDQIFFPSGGFFRYTSAIEDNADLISGVLNAKSGHDASYPKLMYDLMAFTFFYRRAPGSLAFDNVQTWQAQYQQAAPTYSSIAVRKSIIDLGYRGWQQR